MKVLGESLVNSGGLLFVKGIYMIRAQLFGW